MSNIYNKYYPIPNKVNALIIFFQLLGLLTCFYLLSIVNTVISLLLLAVLFGVVMNSVYSTIHEAHHRILFSNRRANDFFGIFLSLFFPAPFHLLRHGHIGHHRKNRSDDEAFDLYFDRDNVIWKYLVWYGILTGIYWIVAVMLNFVLVFVPQLMSSRLFKWDKTSEVFLSHFEDAPLWILRIEALVVILFQFSLFLVVGCSFKNYFIMYFGFGLMWSSLQYVHHYQTERDVISGARNLYIWKPLDFLWLNHNWHQTHHQLPVVPWCYLPIVADNMKTSSCWLLPAYFAMWKGPRYERTSVNEKFEGVVSK